MCAYFSLIFRLLPAFQVIEQLLEWPGLLGDEAACVLTVEAADVVELLACHC